MRFMPVQNSIGACPPGSNRQSNTTTLAPFNRLRDSLLDRAASNKLLISIQERRELKIFSSRMPECAPLGNRKIDLLACPPISMHQGNICTNP